MRKINLIVLFVAVIAGVAGYWMGIHRIQDSGVGIQENPKSQTANRKLLYYRNPMGLPDTSPIPKKDAMGMDYVAVYEGDAGTGEGVVSISVDKVQKLGVKSEAVALRRLDKTLRVTGRVEIDEQRIHTVAPKFEGWVEKLYVNTSGQSVSRGQALFEVYSPELVSVQREYALVKQAEASAADEETKTSLKQLADASLARLKNWDIAATGKRSLTFVSPVSGIVLEKKAQQGMRFMPGEALYQIADLTSVWVLADIPEQDIGQIKLGSVSEINLAAYPDKHFSGKVAFIYPTLNAATRTVQVRVELTNPDGLLKPAMFAEMTLSVGKEAALLTIPASAVIDSGTRQVVLVQIAPGRFEPRTVRLGSRSSDYVEVREGLRVGEQVVTSALFLLDAESNLKAALAGFGGQPVTPAPQEAKNPVTAPGMAKDPAPAVIRKKPAVVGHQAQGILEAINPDGSVSITHEAIKSMGWPGMTMDFILANSSLLSGINPGSAISFELVERKPDEWVITRLQARHKEH